MSVAQGGPSDVKIGEQEQRPPPPLVQLPAQPRIRRFRQPTKRDPHARNPVPPGSGLLRCRSQRRYDPNIKHPPHITFTSRGALRPRFASVSPPLEKEGAGKAGRRSHPRSCAQSARVDHRQPDHPAFPAQRFTAYFALSPVRPCTFATVALRMADASKPGWAACISARLDASMGRQADTTSPSAPVSPKLWPDLVRIPASFIEDSFKRRSFARRMIAHGDDSALRSLARPTLRVHRIPPHVRDVRNAPLGWDGRICKSDLPD